MEREEELAEKTLHALNEMRIKFPGKNDSEAEWILDKVNLERVSCATRDNASMCWI